MSINNYFKIKPLLEWDEDKDLFYYVQLLQRKKDHGVGKVNGTNNNSRAIKEYYIYTQEKFDFYMDEIIKLCNLFGARAGINLNRRSFKKLQLHHLKKITDQMINGESRQAHKAYSSVCGKYGINEDKKWILDVDDLPFNIAKLDEYLYTLQPEGNKIIAEIPSKSGLHIITKPFNSYEFNKEYSSITVCKNNPTNLYIP